MAYLDRRLASVLARLANSRILRFLDDYRYHPYHFQYMVLLGLRSKPDPDEFYAQLAELGAELLYERQEFT
jgi:hypothetical protein